MRILGICLISLLALAGGFGLRYYVEHGPNNQLVITQPAAPSPAPVPPIPTVSGSTHSNASIAYKEITDWVAELPTPIRTDLSAVGALLKIKFQTQRTQSEYSQYDGCANFILNQAITALSASQIDRLRARGTAFSTLIVNPSGASFIDIKRDLQNTLVENYFMPEVISTVGSNVVSSATSRSQTVSRAACQTLDVPQKYK